QFRDATPTPTGTPESPFQDGDSRVADGESCISTRRVGRSCAVARLASRVLLGCRGTAPVAGTRTQRGGNADPPSWKRGLGVLRTRTRRGRGGRASGGGWGCGRRRGGSGRLRGVLRRGRGPCRCRPAR